MLTGSRVSGVTPVRSSQVMYERPNVPSGSRASASMSTVVVLIRGLSFRICLPSGLLSMMSRKRGRAGPAVVSPNAATISTSRVKKRDMVEEKQTHLLVWDPSTPLPQTLPPKMHSRTNSEEYDQDMLAE